MASRCFGGAISEMTSRCFGGLLRDGFMSKNSKNQKIWGQVSNDFLHHAPGITRNCLEWPRIIWYCQESPGIARNCPELPGISRIRPESLGIARNCLELHGVRFQIAFPKGPLLSSLIFLLKDSLKLTNITLLK